MRKRIDAHVHITAPNVRGKKIKRFGTELLEYGYLKMGDGGFQTMPCYIADSQFTADTLVNMMNVYGVEKAVLLQSLMSENNIEVSKAVKKYPDRLAGAMIVEPVGNWQADMQHWKNEGLTAIKFEMRAYTNHACYPDAQYDDEDMTALFDAAEELGLTIVVDPAPVNFPVYNPEAFLRAVQSHPKAHFVLCHLGYPLPIDTPERRDRWRKMVSVVMETNCWVDVSALPDFFDEEGYPYPTAVALMSEVKEMVGSSKFIWGTDITGTLNRATYPQMMKMYELSGVFSETELDDLFYNNAVRAYRL